MRKMLVLLLVLFALAGCRQSAQPTPETSNMNIAVTVEPEPAQVGEAALVITIRDLNGAPAAGAQVEARGDMNHAGMVPVLGSGQTDADGLVRVPFEWTMGGDWIVTITAALADGTSASQTFDFSVAS
jgi:hypothetical protein